MLSIGSSLQWRPLLQEKHREVQPQISRDGRWVAYSSDESGQYEVWVRPFPVVDKDRWQVSNGGGDSPLWAPDGRELFYRSRDAAMAVPIRTGADFSYETPKPLFRGTYVSADMSLNVLESHPWDISPDGKRFLMMQETEPAADAIPRKINIVLNWIEELKQKVPTK
jgi:hypothetical protein